MATHLDLEEQEQLDQLKAFWKQYGTLITWVLILALAGFIGWTQWNNWQHEQSAKAGALYDELDKAVQAGDTDKAARVFADMKERFPRTGYAQQAGLLTAKLQFEKKQAEAARASLAWVSENATEDEYRGIARLRLAGVLLDDKKYDEALKQLEGVGSKEFAALVADRRGDVLLAQGKKEEAKAAFEQAWKAMDESLDYRRMVESKLMALWRSTRRRAAAGRRQRRGRQMSFDMKALRGRAAVALLGVALVGCAGTPRPDPTPLEPLTPQVKGRQIWKQSMGRVKFPLSVAVNGSTFTVADDDGEVMALEADTGRELWRGSVGDKLSAGVGSDGRFASVVTRDNELVTLEAGKVLWRKALPSRVATPPLVAGERVFVQAVDRTIVAFDALDGRKLWSYQRAPDALILSSPGVLMPFKDTLVVGQGAKMAGLDPLRGALRWETTVASPRGTNEVERLADLVGPAARVGDVICARAFQAAVACVNAERGSTVWSRNAGGIVGVGADSQMVVGTDASDRITAWRAADGSVAWTLEKLLYRNLTAPLVVGQAFVMGDVDGMVHWFTRDSGEAVLRMPTDGSAIKVAPVASGLTMLVVTSSGGLFAFRPE